MKQCRKFYFSKADGCVLNARLSPALGRSQGGLWIVKQNEKRILFHLDDSGSLGGAISVRTVALLKVEAEKTFQSHKV